MRIIKVGEQQKAACQYCESFQTVTFGLRDVPFSDGTGMAKKVLVGICDKCDGVALMPHQSTPAVKQQYEAQRKAAAGKSCAGPHGGHSQSGQF